MNGELTEQIRLTWEPLIPLWGLWSGGAAALLVVILLWRGAGGLSGRRRASLTALRLLGLAALVLVVLGPTRVTTKGRASRDPLVVLIDASRSLRVQEDGRTRAERVGEWLRARGADFDELAAEYDLRYVLAGDGLAGFASAARDGESAMAGGGGPGSGEATPADAAITDLGGGLLGLREHLGGARPAGVLLVSDGADRAALGRAWKRGGEQAVVALLDGLPMPVSVWSVGDEAGPPDLAVREAAAPPFGFVRRPVSVEVTVGSRGLPAGVWPVTLRGDEGIEAVREVRLGEGDDATLSFELKPDRIGYHTWRIELPTPAADGVPSNNSIDFTIKVLRDRTRVLQVTSRPSWDVKALRRLLKTDPNIDLVSFFILRQDRFRGNLVDTEELSLIPFPHKELFTTDLQGFDLVIFQNFWFGSFTRRSDDEYMQSVADYVKDGGGLLMVGGDQSLGAARYGASPLGEVLPTQLPDAEPRTDTFQAALTDVGRRHPVTRLDRGPSGGLDRWERLPALQGWNPLGPLQEGAVPLVTAGIDGPPLVAARDVARGRTLAVGTDTTWRWALSGADGAGAGQDHATFWRNAIRWLVKDVEQKQVEVVTDQENYRLGATVRAQVRVLGADYAPRADAQVQGTFARMGGRAEPVEVGGTTDVDGHLALSLPATEEGTWKLQIEVPSIADPYGKAEARVSVSDREGELEDPRANPGLLAAVAEATGGAVLTGDSPDPRKVSLRDGGGLQSTEKRVEPLWAHPGLLLLALLPMGVEWILRRRWGLR